MALSLSLASQVQATPCEESADACLIPLAKASALHLPTPAAQVEGLIRLAKAAAPKAAVVDLLGAAEDRLERIYGVRDLVDQALEIDRIAREAGLNPSAALNLAFDAIELRYEKEEPEHYQTAVSSLIDLSSRQAQANQHAGDRTNELILDILSNGQGDDWDMANAWMLFGKHLAVRGKQDAANEAFERATVIVNRLPLQEDGASPRIAALLSLGQLSGESGDVARASAALRQALDSTDVSDAKTRAAVVAVVAHLLGIEER